MTLQTTPIILSPADFADTGQWRLIIYISARGMNALLRHVSDPERPVVQLFDTIWPETGNDSATLLSRIENAVYDHPSILDDYATDIIIESSRLTWIPSSILEDDEADNPETTVYSTFFPSGPKEVMTDRVGTATALFTLTDGLEGFLGRTLPGARIRSHSGVMAEYMGRSEAEGHTLLVSVHDNMADMTATGPGGSLIASVSYPAGNAHEVSEQILRLIQVFRLPENTRILLAGTPGATVPLGEIMSAYGLSHERFLMAGAPDATSLPTASLILAFRDITPAP